MSSLGPKSIQWCIKNIPHFKDSYNTTKKVRQEEHTNRSKLTPLVIAEANEKV